MCRGLSCQKLQKQYAKAIDISLVGYFTGIGDLRCTVTSNSGGGGRWSNKMC
ncbi:hypothetical protein IC582_029859 [Cucumis melo]